MRPTNHPDLSEFFFFFFLLSLLLSPVGSPMSPSLTNEPSIVTEGEDDLQVQKWLKELDNAEQLMNELEAKTEKLDAKMDAILNSLSDMNKTTSDQALPAVDATTTSEVQADKQ